MKHSAATEQLFDQVIADTPPEIKREVEWSYQIADKIYAALRRKGLSQKDFARLVGTFEAAVSKWIGGGHNFTIATLAKIEVALGEEVIKCKKNMHDREALLFIVHYMLSVIPRHH